MIIIGSGIGGLAAASTLNKMGYRVCVLESHIHPGGCAHSFTIQGFHFDSGPSLFSGFSGVKSPNPLKHVLDFTGASQSINWLTYDTWGISLPYPTSSRPTLTSATIGPTHFQTLLEKFGGPEAKTEWALLMKGKNYSYSIILSILFYSILLYLIVYCISTLPYLIICYLLLYLNFFIYLVYFSKFSFLSYFELYTKQTFFNYYFLSSLI